MYFCGANSRGGKLDESFDLAAVFWHEARKFTYCSSFYKVINGDISGGFCFLLLLGVG